MPDGDKGTAGASAAPGSAAGSEGLLGRLSDLAWRALPAIGSAIGFVGFVAIIGGAIEWIRFDAANLPATQAVLAVPKQELVIVGALALGLFVLGAVLAVLVVYLIDSDGNATPRTAYGLIGVGVIEMAITLRFIGRHEPGKYVWLGIWLILIFVVTCYVVGHVMRDFRRRTKVKKARKRVIDAQAALAAAEDEKSATAELAGPDGGDDGKKAHAKASCAFVAARRRFNRAVGEWHEAAERVLDLQRDGSRSGKLPGPEAKLADVIALTAEEEGKPPPVPGIVTVEARLDEAERMLGHAFQAALGQMVGDIASPLPEVEEANPAANEQQAEVATTNRQQAEARKRKVNGAIAWIVVWALVVLVLIGIGFGVLADELTWVAILIVVVALLTAMNVFVARATDKFTLYGIAVFFSVLLFGAALTIARTLHEPKVQPVALLRKGNDIGTCGVYITQTGGRVYVGRLPSLGERPGEIFWVPTSDVDLVSVGQPELVRDKKHKKTFSDYAVSMLERIYKDRAEEVAPTQGNEKITEEGKKPASKKQAKKIHGLHVVTDTVNREVAPKKLRSKANPPVKTGKRCTATQEVEKKS